MGLGKRIRSEWPKIKARYIDRGRLRKMPDTIVLELTDRCTLACSCCPNGLDRGHCRKPHTMSAAEFRRIRENLDIGVRNVFLHLHGEPFLNEDLPEIASMLLDSGVSRISVFSNAYNIRLDVLERLLGESSRGDWNIAFSTEIYDREVYEGVRTPGDFDRMWENMRCIDSLMERYGMGYGINAILDASGIDKARNNLRSVFQELRNLRNVHFSSRFPWPHLPQSGDLAGRISSRRPICSQIRELPVVFSNGDVAMCNSDYRGESVIGSLLETRMSRLINCRKARRFRLNVLHRRPERNAVCAECLIDRYRGFQRTVGRKFILTASEENLDRYFDSFRRFYYGEE